jgi:hypothetical protein
MPMYLSVLLLSVLSISVSANYSQADSRFSKQLPPSHSDQFVSVQKTEKENDKSPHRGTGRRDFYQSKRPVITEA